MSELARLFQAYADSSSLEGIAMKACTLIPILLLQKPSRTSKSKEHATHLQRRLELWQRGDIPSLLDEGRCIQKHLHHSTKQPDDEAIARTFRNLMLQGKTQSALRYLSRNTNGGVLQLDDLVPETADTDETEMHTVRDILHNKYPLGKDPLPCTLLYREPDSVNPIVF